MKNKQKRSGSFDQKQSGEFIMSTSIEKFSPATCDYLKEARRIQKNAKQTSNTINLQFRKYTNKPEVTTVYVDSSNVSKKLQQMNTRVNANKYEMIIQVKKDAIDNLATKKPAIRDQIEHKKYEYIYKQFLRGQNTGNPLQITNPTIRQYQFYDQQDKCWKQNLKNKGLICRQIFKQKQEKIIQALSKKDDQSMSDSQVTPDYFNNYDNYSEVYDGIVQNNELLAEKNKTSPNPQTIVLDRFQAKFYKCRQKKFQHVYDRFNEGNNQEGKGYLSTNSELTSPQKKMKNNSVNLKIPQSCKQVYNTQNKLLAQSMSNGLSKDHTKKLIVQFNKTILDMKAKDQKIKIKQKNMNNRLNKKQDSKIQKLFKQFQKTLRQVSTSHPRNFRLKKKSAYKNISISDVN